jgi:predicted nuclease of predicted toxin-antitoxin system
MTLRLLIDMNLSIEWVAALAQHGYDAVHWSAVGDPKATDAEIMARARWLRNASSSRTTVTSAPCSR